MSSSSTTTSTTTTTTTSQFTNPLAPGFLGRDQDRTVFNVVGTTGIPGRYSYAKATGEAVFGRDIVGPNMLHAKFLHSPYAAATITAMDVSAAQALPGVVDIVTWEDPTLQGVMYPGGNGKPMLGNTAEREGDEVGCIICAESEVICDQALSLVKVTWQQLPFYLNAEDATAQGATVLFPNASPLVAGTNIQTVTTWSSGNATSALAQADHVLNFTLSTGGRTHVHWPPPTTRLAYYGPDPKGTDGQVLLVDNQPNSTASALATGHPEGTFNMALSRFNVPWNKIHTISPYMSGRYCSYWDEERHAYFAILLTQRTGSPVRVVSSRRDTFCNATGVSTATCTVGYMNDGTIVAAETNCVTNRGDLAMSMEYGPGGFFFTTTNCTNLNCSLTWVYTNTVAARHPNSGVVPPGDEVHQAEYMIADALGMDPTEVALKNVRATGSSIVQCVNNGKAAINWQWHATGAKTLPDGRMHGYGFVYHDAHSWGSDYYNVSVCIKTDGNVYFPIMEADIGTHWEDAVAMVIAEELGANIGDVIAESLPDDPLWSQGTAEDRGASSTWVAKEAALNLKANLLSTAAATAVWGPSSNATTTPAQLGTNNSTVYLLSNPTQSYPFSKFSQGTHNLYASYVGRPPKDPRGAATTGPYNANVPLGPMCATFCEVAVDKETGQVEVLDWVVAVDAGKCIRPSSYTGQIEGPIMHCDAHNMLEDLIYDPATGVRLNASTLGYMPLTILDLPPITCSVMESRLGGGAYGAVGNSHFLNVQTIVSLAVYNAIGQWVYPPITPDKVLAALGTIPASSVRQTGSD